MSLRISDQLSLPKDATLWTFADLAIKGAGKTYAASDLAEEMIKNGTPIVALDPVGIWWGLRVGAEGHEGLPVVIFGGDHKDIPIPTRIDSKSKFPQIDEERLKILVKSILEAGISAVVDTSEFSKHMQRRASTIILRELYQLNKNYGVRHIFLEEADTLAPQRLSGELNESFGAVDEIVRRGGNFNLGITLISQRCAVLNKDVLTQCNCLIILRILAKLDKDAVATWVKEISGKDPKKYSKWYNSLKDLENGEAWIWHPESDLFKKIQFRKRETLHATREYFRQEQWEQKNIKLMNVGEYISKFKKVFEPKKELPKQLEEDHQREKQVITEAKEQNRQFMERTDLENARLKESQFATMPDVPSFQREERPVKLVDQSLPNILVQQYKPSLQFSVELPNEPSSMLGKVAIVLNKGPAPSNQNSKWTKSAIKKKIEDHEWDSAGYEDVISQLIRWEILQNASDGHLKYDPKRISVTERS